MNTGADWKPGYSTVKTRYPFDGIESMTYLSANLRANFSMDQETNAVGVFIDANVFPIQHEQITREGVDIVDHKQFLIDFLMDRAYEYQNALKVAEDQVAELLSEDPFIPEQFGFELVHEPETIHDAPIRIYQSRFDDKYSIHRPIANTLDKDWNPALWILQKRCDDNTFTSEEVILPCHRIAYAFFFAKNIQVMTKFVEESDGIEEAVVIEETPVIQPVKGMNNYTVIYLEQASEDKSSERTLAFENIIAGDEKDAQSKVKFLIETGEYGIELVNFDELTPLLKISNK